MANAQTLPPDITNQTGRSSVNWAGENSVEAAGANNIMAEFYTIAETGLPEPFGKQLGTYRRRQASTSP